MSHAPISGVILTPHALTRHAKRLRSLMADHGVPLTTTQSQEAFARVLGMKNWHEAHEVCARAQISSLAPHRSPLLPLPADKESLMYPGDLTEDFDPGTVEKFLIWACAMGATDITIHTDGQAYIQTKDGLYPATVRPLTHQEVLSALDHLYGSSSARHMTGEIRDIDFPYDLSPTRGQRLRFRVNAVGVIAGGKPGVQICLHQVAVTPIPLEETGMPSALVRHLESMKTGVCIFGGQTGDGCSTSITSMMHAQLKRPEGGRLLTFENPIEHVYDKMFNPSFAITQSETVIKKNLLGSILKTPNRPSTVVVGECRDTEVLSEIIKCAAAGNQVITHTHTMSVVDTFIRLQRMWPEEERHSRMGDLIASLNVVVAQRCIRISHKTPCREWEYLVMNDEIKQQLNDANDAGPDELGRKINHWTTAQNSRFIDNAQQDPSRYPLSDKERANLLELSEFYIPKDSGR